MSDFLEALAATREAYRQDEYIDRVKKLISSKIFELDRAALIEDTHYFNHSAIPDFVVTWSGEKASRDFYLRGSYAQILASRDVEATAAGDPVFMSLDANLDFSAEQPPISPQMIENEPRKSTHTMLTDVRAMGEILEPVNSETTPLTEMVRSSFVRGGRGLIDERRAGQLVTAQATTDSAELTKIVRESFFENVAVRMERTATIVELALSESRGRVLDSLDLAKMVGRLSKTELQSILPWLLKQENAVTSPNFWRQLGEMTSFRDLEEIGRQLEGLDVGKLVAANADTWEAQRAYLGVSSLLAKEMGDEEAPPRHQLVPTWSFRAGVLGLEVGSHRVSFSSDGRILKGRDEDGAPSWDNLKVNLEPFQLGSVNLRGVTRSIRIDAEQSLDIRQDVEDVTESLDDQYSVAEVALRFSPRNTKTGLASVSVRFGKGLVISDGGATIADLAKSSLEVLAYRSPLDAPTLDGLIAHVNPAGDFVAIEASQDVEDRQGDFDDYPPLM